MEMTDPMEIFYSQQGLKDYASTQKQNFELQNDYEKVKRLEKILELLNKIGDVITDDNVEFIYPEGLFDNFKTGAILFTKDGKIIATKLINHGVRFEFHNRSDINSVSLDLTTIKNRDSDKTINKAEATITFFDNKSEESRNCKLDSEKNADTRQWQEAYFKAIVSIVKFLTGLRNE